MTFASPLISQTSCANFSSSDDACTGKIGSLRAAEGRDEEEEDEFEREMDSEVMGLLALISSPSALRAAVMKESASRPRKQREEIERGRRRQQSSVAKKAGAAPVGRYIPYCPTVTPCLLLYRPSYLSEARITRHGNTTFLPLGLHQVCTPLGLHQVCAHT